MSNFQPPPTYALPILVDERTGLAQFNPIWLKWFVDMAKVLSQLGAGGDGGVAQHNSLGGLQGGATNQYYHLSYSQYAAIAGSIPAPAFPVDSIFVTVSTANPATLLGYGTWAPFGAGRVLVGVDAGDPDFNPVEKTGGSKTQTFPV